MKHRDGEYAVGALRVLTGLCGALEFTARVHPCLCGKQLYSSIPLILTPAALICAKSWPRSSWCTQRWPFPENVSEETKDWFCSDLRPVDHVDPMGFVLMTVDKVLSLILSGFCGF